MISSSVAQFRLIQKVVVIFAGASNLRRGVSVYLLSSPVPILTAEADDGIQCRVAAMPVKAVMKDVAKERAEATKRKDNLRANIDSVRMLNSEERMDIQQLCKASVFFAA